MAERWDNLPQDLVIAILQRSEFADDFVRNSCVSKSWRSATVYLKNDKPPKFPWLMLAEDERHESDEEISPHRRGFFNLSTGKTYNLELAEAYGRSIVGANYGWLVTTGKDLRINLLHPFSRHQLALPPMPTFPNKFDQRFDIFVHKVALSSTPLNSKCTVTAIYGNLLLLAFAGLGDKSWTNVQSPSKCFHDIVFHKGKFYAVDCHGAVFVCDIHDQKSGPTATQIAARPERDNKDIFQKYLVEWTGNLLLVSRVISYRPGDEDVMRDEDLARDYEYDYLTRRFAVWKLEYHESEEEREYPCSWSEVKSLGDKAVFVGRNSSVCLSATDSCVKPNSIYFTDDQLEQFYDSNPGGGHDMGVYDILHATIEPVILTKSQHSFSPPLWII